MENTTVKDLADACGGILLWGDENTLVEHISLDSRSMEGRDLFVPLIGEKTDAHRFISQAFENGAVATLTSEHGSVPWTEREPAPRAGNESAPWAERESAPRAGIEPGARGKAWIAVEDTKLALQAIGRWYRKKLTLPLVGITGSVGKTTTKEMTAAALSAGLRTYKTRGSRNSQVGVPVTITEIDQKDEIGVIELGMSEPGELTVIARMAQVETAVITNIGVAHMEQMGSQEAIFREKMTIQDGLKQGGVLLLNGDDPFLAGAKARDGFRTVYYGTGSGCDYRAADIRTEKGFPAFTAVCRHGSGGSAGAAPSEGSGEPAGVAPSEGSGESAGGAPPESSEESAGTGTGPRKVSVRLKVPGTHQILNALAALAVADLYGVPLEAAAAGLGEYTGMKGRQQIRQAGGITVIDDSYNANPVSMKGAIDVLAAVEGAGRKIAVLADMKELGADSVRFHRETGEYLAAKPVDVLVTYGELAKEIENGAGTGAGTGAETPGASGRTGRLRMRHFAESEKDGLFCWLERELRDGDWVLFKGSNTMNLGEAADHVCQYYH